MSGKVLQFPCRKLPEEIKKRTVVRSLTHICSYHQEKFSRPGQLDPNPANELCRIIICENQGVYIPDPLADDERWPFIKKSEK